MSEEKACSCLEEFIFFGAREKETEESESQKIEEYILWLSKGLYTLDIFAHNIVILR